MTKIIPIAIGILLLITLSEVTQARNLHENDSICPGEKIILRQTKKYKKLRNILEKTNSLHLQQFQKGQDKLISSLCIVDEEVSENLFKNAVYSDRRLHSKVKRKSGIPEFIDRKITIQSLWLEGIDKNCSENTKYFLQKMQVEKELLEKEMIRSEAIASYIRERSEHLNQLTEGYPLIRRQWAQLRRIGQYHHTKVLEITSFFNDRGILLPTLAANIEAPTPTADLLKNTVDTTPHQMPHKIPSVQSGINSNPDFAIKSKAEKIISDSLLNVNPVNKRRPGKNIIQPFRWPANLARSKRFPDRLVYSANISQLNQILLNRQNPAFEFSLRYQFHQFYSTGFACSIGKPLFSFHSKAGKAESGSKLIPSHPVVEWLQVFEWGKKTALVSRIAWDTQIKTSPFKDSMTSYIGIRISNKRQKRTQSFSEILWNSELYKPFTGNINIRIGIDLFTKRNFKSKP